MIEVIVFLKVKDPALFSEFENSAFNILTKYDGELITAFVPKQMLEKSSSYDELHYLKFPDAESFDAYQNDPELAQLAELRKQAISHTEIMVFDKNKSS